MYVTAVGAPRWFESTRSRAVRHRTQSIRRLGQPSNPPTRSPIRPPARVCPSPSSRPLVWADEARCLAYCHSRRSRAARAAASERATSEPPSSPILGGAIRSMGGHAAPPGGPVGARSLDRGPVDRPAMPVKCWDCRRRSDSEAGARAKFSSTRPPRAASFHPLLDDDVRSFCAAALLGC